MSERITIQVTNTEAYGSRAAWIKASKKREYVGMAFVKLEATEGEVATLIVEPIHRRQGIRNILLAAAEKYSRQAGIKRLTMHCSGEHTDKTAINRGWKLHGKNAILDLTK